MRKATTTPWLLAAFLAIPPFALGQDSSTAASPQAGTSAAEPELRAGLASYRRLRFSEAERHFRAAVEADPGSAAAHFYLGYSIYKIAEPKRPNDPGKQRAAEEFAKAYALDPLFVPEWRVPTR